MTSNRWEDRARQFVSADSELWKTANGDRELRMAVVDIHTALEDSLRRYLVGEHGLTEVTESSKYSFPAVVRLLKQCAGNKVVDRETSERLLDFNSLRNQVAHEHYVPTRSQVQEGAECAAAVVRGLVRMSEQRSFTHPRELTTEHRRGKLILALGSALALGFSALYVILPDVFPLNPIDDLIVCGPCALLGIVLMVIALAQRAG